MSDLSKQERRKLRRERRREEKEMRQKENSRNSRNKNIRLMSLLFLVVGSVGYLSYMVYSTPSGYVDFVECLKGKGVVIYGNDWCKYTEEQMKLFGNSAEGLNYVKCDSNTELCNSKGVSITPTWEISGKMVSGYQTIQTLSSLSGCL